MKRIKRNINSLIIPTGIGAKYGGFAGDGTPVAKLLAKASDLLITHPNVINAALLTDVPKNVLVLEGYLMDRFFANQVVLRENFKHKIAVVVDSSASTEEQEITINCLNAARNVYGLDIMDTLYLTEESVDCSLKKVANIDTLLEACKQAVADGATALAVLCVLPDPTDSPEAEKYLKGDGVDPIGKIEAYISHTVSRQFLIPSAHAPILRPGTKHEGVVHPRVAAEQLGFSYLASVFKCLQHSPQIIPKDEYYKLLTSDYTEPAELGLKERSEDLRVGDVKNLVVPYDCCNAVPMIEAHNHEITLLSVMNNQTILDEPADFFAIPHVLVHNYLEAAGYLLANTNDLEYVNPALFLDEE